MRVRRPNEGRWRCSPLVTVLAICCGCLVALIIQGPSIVGKLVLTSSQSDLDAKVVEQQAWQWSLQVGIQRRGRGRAGIGRGGRIRQSGRPRHLPPPRPPTPIPPAEPSCCVCKLLPIALRQAGLGLLGLLSLLACCLTLPPLQEDLDSLQEKVAALTAERDALKRASEELKALKAERAASKSAAQELAAVKAEREGLLKASSAGALAGGWVGRARAWKGAELWPGLGRIGGRQAGSIVRGCCRGRAPGSSRLALSLAAVVYGWSDSKPLISISRAQQGTAGHSRAQQGTAGHSFLSL
jgi:hypothetical protein